MRRVSPASVLLVIGAVLLIVALPLQWQTVTATRGTSLSSTGLDYPGYDIAVTVIFALLLVATALLLAAAWRWAALFGTVIGLLACLWAALVLLAAGYPANGGSTSDVTVTLGIGVFILAAGALLGLIGGVLSFRGGGVPAIAAGAQRSM